MPELIYRRQRKSNWTYALNTLFGSIGVVLITQLSKQKGAWKLGKTDFSLFLAENCLKYGLVKEVASNINTKGRFPQIADLISLRHWLFGNNRTKLYIFDELNKHVPRRRAMSNKNIGVIQVFPEISKARARLIGVGQDLLSIDKEILRDIWVKGIFIKRKLKNVELISHLIGGKMNFKVPATTIPFDPYEIAPFTEKPTANIMFKDEDLQKLYSWAKEGGWRNFFKHPQECNRFVRKNVVRLLEKLYADKVFTIHTNEK